MLPTIEHSEKFKNEYNDFKARISAINNESVKTELTRLLTQLLREVRALDEQHQDLFTRKELPSIVPDTRNKIVEVRKLVLKRLEDWERANPKL